MIDELPQIGVSRRDVGISGTGDVPDLFGLHDHSQFNQVVRFGLLTFIEQTAENPPWFSWLIIFRGIDRGACETEFANYDNSIADAIPEKLSI
jgi:hypothetical protein